MPFNNDLSLRPFNSDEIALMQIQAVDVRFGGHPTETRELNQSTAVRTFLVAWAQRFNFFELALGDSSLTSPSDGSNPKISRLVPDSTFGRMPTAQQMIATKIISCTGHKIIGLDPLQVGMPLYQQAEVKVLYEHVPFRVRTDTDGTREFNRYTTRGPNSEVQAEAIGMPGGAFKYVNQAGTGAHGKQFLANYTVVRPVERWTYYWEMIPNDLYDTNGALFDRLYIGDDGGVEGNPDVPYLGCVNQEPLWDGRPAGTVLLEGVQPELLRSPLAGLGSNGWRWRIGFKFAYCPLGWLNLFYFNPASPNDNGWYQMSVSGVFKPINLVEDYDSLYNIRDLNLLWQPF